MDLVEDKSPDLLLNATTKEIVFPCEARFFFYKQAKHLTNANSAFAVQRYDLFLNLRLNLS